MKRRRFVATTCGLSTVISPGCLTEADSEPKPEIGLLEVENHRQDESYEFTIRIENEETPVFDETHRLDPAGSGNDAIVIENPVEPGEYTVRVDVAEYSAIGETQELISDGQTCLQLQFYLGSETLHMEHRLYDRCD